MAQARESKSDKEWISVHEASVLIGVSPATLRRWSDAGEIRAFTTPGGHRRFARSAILALLPASRDERPTLVDLGETAAHMIGVYRRQLADRCFGLVWMKGLDEDERRSFRALGRRLTETLLEALDASTPESYVLAVEDAREVAAEFGRMSAARHVDARQTVEAFLRFRLPFLRELAAVGGRRGLEIREATDLLERAVETIDQLIMPLLEGHSLAAGPAPAPAVTPLGVTPA